MLVTETNDERERSVWNEVMHTLLYYNECFLWELNKRQELITKLPNKFSSLLSTDRLSKFSHWDVAAQSNQQFFENLVRFETSSSFNDEKIVFASNIASIFGEMQQRHNLIILRSIYHEWSSEGSIERMNVFGLIFKELLAVLPVDQNNMYKRRIVVPDCGLGRLPLEVAALGYCCQGNQSNTFKTIASNFILNGINKRKSYLLYPWISSASNLARIEDSMQTIQVPDVTAEELLSSFHLPAIQSSHIISGEVFRSPYPKFSMAVGDFVSLYGKNRNSCCGDDDVNIDDDNDGDDNHESAWDAVVTCFLLDNTTPNVLEYIETIHHILRPGGVWINLGPLSYHQQEYNHYANDPPSDVASLELNYDEIKNVILGFGFQYLLESWHDCCYNKCSASMSWEVHRSVLFTVLKPFPTQEL